MKNEADKTNGLAKCEAALEAIEQKETEDKIAAAKQAKQRKKIGVIAGIAAAAVVAVVLVVTQIIMPANATKKANELLAAGEYQAAYEMLQESSKATETLDRCRYQWANVLLADDTEKAVELYQEIENPKNIAGEDLEQGYKNAFALLDKHDPANAQALFELLGGYESSAQYAEYCATYIDGSEHSISYALEKYSQLPKDFLDVEARMQFIKEFLIIMQMSSRNSRVVLYEETPQAGTEQRYVEFCGYEFELSIEGLKAEIQTSLGWGLDSATQAEKNTSFSITDFELCLKIGYVQASNGIKIYKDYVSWENIIYTL